MTKEIKNTAKLQIIEDSKHEPDLKAAQEFVGGYVEGITFPNGDYLIINEEGKIKNHSWLYSVSFFQHVTLEVV